MTALPLEQAAAQRGVARTSQAQSKHRTDPAVGSYLVEKVEDWSLEQKPRLVSEWPKDLARAGYTVIIRPKS
jgi:hypothetical protein